MIKNTAEMATDGLDLTKIAKETGNMREDETGLLPIVSETREVLEKINDKLENINNTTEQKQRGAQIADNYVCTASLKSKSKIMESTHSIILRSSNDIDTSRDVPEKIMAAVDASITGIKIDRVRKVKDQKVVIGCNKKEEIDRVSQRLCEVAPVLNVESIENKDP